MFGAQHGESGRRFRNDKQRRRRHGVSSSRIAFNSLARAALAIGYCGFSAFKVASTICDTIKRVLFLSSAATSRASFVFYNSMAEVDARITGICSVQKVFA